MWCGDGDAQPRKGIERERYVCRRRIEEGPGACDQPSVRRELIDQPFLAHPLDGYLDLEATRQRISERAASSRSVAEEAVEQAQNEAGRAESRLARVQRGWQDGVLDDDDYRQQRDQVRDELDAAQAALRRAEDHLTALIEQPDVDAEQVLLSHLAALKRAVSDTGQAAADLDTLRGVIGQMFQSVELIDHANPFGARSYPTTIPEGNSTEGGVVTHPPGVERDPQVGDGDRRYWLLLKLRSSAVDPATFKPTGQLTPVPPSPQYPHGFLCRYCWW
jgi:hypothetical protein